MDVSDWVQSGRSLCVSFPFHVEHSLFLAQALTGQSLFPGGCKDDHRQTTENRLGLSFDRCVGRAPVQGSSVSVAQSNCFGTAQAFCEMKGDISSHSDRLRAVPGFGKVEKCIV